MPKGENSKKVAGQARKAEAVENKAKKVQAVVAQKEDEEWSKGAKGKSAKEDKAAKEEAVRQRKAEAARLLAEEEASLPSKPKLAPPKANSKKISSPQAAIKSAGPPETEFEEPTSFSARGIDDALDMMSLVTEKTDKAALGSKASKDVELHPERRFKAAFEEYKHDHLVDARKENPGLRLQQVQDLLFKQFQKSPRNPFNQVNLAYDSTKEDKVAALKAARSETAQRLRDD